MLSTIVFLLLATSPALVSSLRCHVCREPIRVNYTVTKDNVPALPSDCTVIEASVCWSSVFWELDRKHTQLEFRGRPGPPEPNSTVHDRVSVRIMKDMGPDNVTLQSAQELDFECATSDTCSGPAGIQKVLGALTVQDQFQQQIAPLLKLIRPFNPREADCAYIHNTTFRCPEPSFQNCHRCTIEAGVLKPNECVCATCQPEPIRDNFVDRFSTFNLQNRTDDFSAAGLGCQLKGCNSLENINLVFKSSTIQFNSEEYYKN